MSDDKWDEGVRGEQAPQPTDAQAPGNAVPRPVLSYATPPTPGPINRLAIWAMVSGLSFWAALWLSVRWNLPGILVFVALPITAIAAILLGRKGRHPTTPVRGRRLAEAAFFMGWLSLSLFLIAVTVVPLLDSALRRGRARSEQIACAWNLRKIGECLQLYANANNGLLPSHLGVLIATADLEPRGLVCPGSDDTRAEGATTQAIVHNTLTRKGHCSYVYVGADLSPASLTGNHVVAYDSSVKHHKDRGMNVLYGDGHVEWIQKKDAVHLLAELEAGHNPPRPAGGVAQ